MGADDQNVEAGIMGTGSGKPPPALAIREPRPAVQDLSPEMPITALREE